MAYDEPSFRRAHGDVPDTSPYRGEPGFREEPDFWSAGSRRLDAASYQQGTHSVTDYSTDASETTLGLGRRPGSAGVSPVALDDVFDDPDHGDPGRDRMGFHLSWELVLLIAIGALGYLLWRDHADLLRGGALKTLLVDLAALGFVTLGAGLSLRAAAPNLAVGPVAVAAAIYFAQEGDAGVVPTTGKIAIAALALGAVLAILVVGFHVPGWAASLAVAFAAIVYTQRHSGPVEVISEYAPTLHAYYLAGAFAALGVLGGLIGAIKTVRRAIGRFRPVGDPARRRGGVAGSLTAGALILSTVLASVGGVLIAANHAQVERSLGLEWTGLAIGAALLGGTSAFGRRGGIFGTVFAVVLVGIFLRFNSAENLRISIFAVAAGVLVCGLIVTRLVETLGRPESARDLDDEDSDETWMSSGGTQPLSGPSWSSSRQDSWPSSLPTQPSTGRTADLWSDDRWGSRSTS